MAGLEYAGHKRAIVPIFTVTWRGKCYDADLLLEATPIELTSKAVEKAYDAQSWWDEVVRLAPATAGNIAASIAH